MPTPDGPRLRGARPEPCDERTGGGEGIGDGGPSSGPASAVRRPSARSSSACFFIKAGVGDPQVAGVAGQVAARAWCQETAGSCRQPANRPSAAASSGNVYCQSSGRPWFVGYRHSGVSARSRSTGNSRRGRALPDGRSQRRSNSGPFICAPGRGRCARPPATALRDRSGPVAPGIARSPLRPARHRPACSPARRRGAPVVRTHASRRTAQ